MATDKTGVAVLGLLIFLASFIFLLAYPTKTVLIGEGKLVVVNGVNVADLTMNVRVGTTTNIFVWLSQSEEVVLFYVNEFPDVLYPNKHYKVWRRINFFGMPIGTFLEEA